MAFILAESGGGTTGHGAGMEKGQTGLKCPI